MFQSYVCPRLAAVNWVWLKMLYISARNSSVRLSLLIGKVLENVMSQLSMRVCGIGNKLPVPAFPKHSGVSPTPIRGLAFGVKLHGSGCMTEALLKIWLPGVPLTKPCKAAAGVGPPLNETWEPTSSGLLRTSSLAPSGDVPV